MSDYADSWPQPVYDPGPSKNLHALGVISILFNSFEASMFGLYRHHLDIKKVPYELTNFIHASLNEHLRLDALKIIFDKYENDRKVVSIVDNLIQYFNWCSDARNKLLHAERYPALFVKQDMLYLCKKKNKKSMETVYMIFDLHTLRETADRINCGIIQSAKVKIYLRVRDIPVSQLSPGYKDYEHEPLPRILTVPNVLEVAERPYKHSKY
jgi:hypothetical protein